MIKQSNVELSKKTTFHVGGIAKTLLIPENHDELVQTAIDLYRADGKLYILSGGSNLLINDEREFPNVIYMSKACLELEERNNGQFYVGASNRIQKVINFVNEKGYGGFEELYGLPALFGGIIYMNAGIGGKKNSKFTIGQFIKRVKVLNLESGEIEWLNKDACKFNHRSSVFQSNKYVILGADIRLVEQEYRISKAAIEKRMKFCKNNYEYGKGCFGTCFAERNGKLLIAVAMVKKNRGEYLSQRIIKTGW